jgi:hypothetical protein
VKVLFYCVIWVTFLRKIQGDFRRSAARFKLKAFAGAGLTIIQALRGMLVWSDDPGTLPLREHAVKQSKGV